MPRGKSTKVTTVGPELPEGLTGRSVAPEPSLPEFPDNAAPVDAPEDGPRIGSRGEYLPHTYPTKRGNVRTDA